MRIRAVQRINDGDDLFEDFGRLGVLAGGQLISQLDRGLECGGFVAVVGEVHPGDSGGGACDGACPRFGCLARVAQFLDGGPYPLEPLDVRRIADHDQQ